MERKDVMSKNVAIYKAQASALEKNAAPGCKVCGRQGNGGQTGCAAQRCSATNARATWLRPAPSLLIPAAWAGSGSGLQQLQRRAQTRCATKPAARSLPSRARLRAAPLQVLVVANPANTNSLILKEHAPSIPAGGWAAAGCRWRQFGAGGSGVGARQGSWMGNGQQQLPSQVTVPCPNPAHLPSSASLPALPAENITCLTRLDHNRALGQVRLSSGLGRAALGAQEAPPGAAPAPGARPAGRTQWEAPWQAGPWQATLHLHPTWPLPLLLAPSCCLPSLTVPAASCCLPSVIVPAQSCCFPSPTLPHPANLPAAPAAQRAQRGARGQGQERNHLGQPLLHAGEGHGRGLGAEAHIA